MAQAYKRLEKELRYFNGEECEEGYAAGPIDESDMFLWSATFQGPENTPYEGGTFVLRIEFSKDYPFKPPKVTSETKIYHPNFKISDGRILLDLLYHNWSPEIKLIDIMKAIQKLLEVPNLDYFLEREIGKQLKKDKKKFISIAKEWTEKYAYY